ncbi:MAG: hypothetical protein ACREQB_10530 [Candidatus Binataceae bacterium]
MNDGNLALRRGTILLRLGTSLFLIGLLVGLAISNFGGALNVFALPRAALSAHLIGLMQGTFLVAIGTVWPLLRLASTLSRATFWLLVYGFAAAFVANLLAAVWGAGGSMLPQSTGGIQGSALEETVIAIILRTAAVSQIAAVALIVWGLRPSRTDQA